MPPRRTVTKGGWGGGEGGKGGSREDSRGRTEPDGERPGRCARGKPRRGIDAQGQIPVYGNAEAAGQAPCRVVSSRWRAYVGEHIGAHGRPVDVEHNASSERGKRRTAQDRGGRVCQAPP